MGIPAKGPSRPLPPTPDDDDTMRRGNNSPAIRSVVFKTIQRKNKRNLGFWDIGPMTFLKGVKELCLKIM